MVVENCPCRHKSSFFSNLQLCIGSHERSSLQIILGLEGRYRVIHFFRKSNYEKWIYEVNFILTLGIFVGGCPANQQDYTFEQNWNLIGV